MSTCLATRDTLESPAWALCCFSQTITSIHYAGLNLFAALNLCAAPGCAARTYARAIYGMATSTSNLTVSPYATSNQQAGQESLTPNSIFWCNGRQKILIQFTRAWSQKEGFILKRSLLCSSLSNSNTSLAQAQTVKHCKTLLLEAVKQAEGWDCSKVNWQHRTVLWTSSALRNSCVSEATSIAGLLPRFSEWTMLLSVKHPQWLRKHP